MTEQWLEQLEKRREAREAANRSFDLRGETLTVKAGVAPQITIPVQNALNTAAVENQAVAEATEKGQPPSVRTVTNDMLVDLADETILACLTVDCHSAWKRLRDPNAPIPVTEEELFIVMWGLVAKIANLPTDAPAVSSNGRAPTDRSSTDASPSPARARKSSRSAST